MKSKCCLVALFVSLLVDIIAADVHSYGYRLALGENTLGRNVSRKELYRSDSMEPKNYTIIFRYNAINPGPVIMYAAISVENNPSQGEFEVNPANKSIEATIRIVNGINVVVTFDLETFGHTEALDHFLSGFLHAGNRYPDSFTIVHIQDTKPKSGTPFKHNAVGQRQANDRLIYFSSRNVTNVSRFASRDFEYAGGEGEAISYVGFSFDSPTAVAYLNSSFIRENQFAAVVYDLSTPYFIANMSVFGYDRSDKPDGFLPIVRV